MMCVAADSLPVEELFIVLTCKTERQDFVCDSVVFGVGWLTVASLDL